MKEIILTQGKVALVDDADFEWLNQWKWFAYKDANTYYAHRSDRTGPKQRIILMHREILGLTDPKIHGDHKDRNGLNNQRNNLRTANNSQNMANRRSHIDSTSEYLGVYYYKRDRNWRARITKDRKDIFIGGYDSEYEAALAYNEVAIQLHGQFANLNKV